MSTTAHLRRDERRPSPLDGPVSERVRFILLLTVLGLCLIGGGASRADAASLLYLRPALILCIAAILLTPGPIDLRSLRVPFMLLAAFAGLMALQLVPLPPGVWAALPGHERYVEAALAAGIPQPWRPISLTPDLTWNSLLALLPVLATLLGIAAIRRDQCYALLYVLIGFACASAVLGILQLNASEGSPLFLYRVTHSGSAVGFFANRNHQAALLAMTFPLLRLWTMMPHPDPQWRRSRLWLAVGLGVFLVPMILVTGSRAGLALGLVGLAGALLLGPIEGVAGVGRWGRLRLTAIFVVPFAIAAAVLVLGRAVAIQRLLMPNGFEDEPRFGEMPVVLDMIREFFPVGSGLGSFEPLFRGFEPDQSLSVRYFNHVHNDLLELAITGGIVGLALLAAFVAWWIFRSFVSFRPYRSLSQPALFARAGSIMILILFLASVFDYPLRTPLMAALIAVAAAWLARGGAAPVGREPEET